MPMKSYDVIAIGWDVGGWQGKKQAVAIAAWNRGDAQVTWLGISRAFSFGQSTAAAFATLANDKRNR
ncbi:hypothetical protein [Ferrimonas balearica]|uniref:hypothetical protein n=1 Tax=Ferrimonas balearica TaxID=44012 RepID=UPI001C5B5FDF|nr:hypothetical protein [Ferrimonas balearica]MBW3166103.1 hypothetical protein [Ferrimonas balearica]